MWAHTTGTSRKRGSTKTSAAGETAPQTAGAETCREYRVYSALVFLIISALFIRTTSNGSPRSLAGFTGMVVLSGSMQAEIPKGSLVIAQQVDPKTLQIGDDITFMANPTTTDTHRIIGIIEDYEDTGQRAFQTQGIMNDEPDAQPVPAVNVVGKVIFHSEVLGQIAGFMGQYWLFILFAAAVVIGLTVILKRIYQKEPKQTAH
ncbi:MAG: signal peptidase I [Neglectibacter sp.]